MRAREREESAERTEEKKLKSMKNAVSALAYPSHALLVRVVFNDGPLRLLLFQLVGLSILRVTTVYFIAIVRYENNLTKYEYCL